MLAYNLRKTWQSPEKETSYYSVKMTKLAIRTRLTCCEFHCSNGRKTDSVPKLRMVFVVRAMIDLAYPFLCPTVLLAVVPIAEQTGLHVSDGLQTGMLWITWLHAIANIARQHIRLFGCFMQSEFCRVKCDSSRAWGFVNSQVVGFDYHFVVGVELLSLVKSIFTTFFWTWH
jgi:hypothetical protein